ncbi:MAG: hypothetical protein Phog2KO_08610 [Phototrophicaceae bacterium]
MMKNRIRSIAILVAILAILLAACGPQETETPEPTDAPTEEVVETEEVEATEEVVETEEVEATEEMEATEEAMDDMEATEEAMDDMEATEEAMDDMEATEEAMDDMEATEEAMDDMEATEEAMDDMEATEEAMMDDMEATEEAMMDDMEATEEAMMDDMEATEEAMMDDMEATEEAMMDDMSDMAVASFDDEAGFTFDYPEGYEINASNNAINLAMDAQRIVVIPPASYSTVLGDSDLEGEEQLTFFLERVGYTVNGTAEMMMTAASVNVEVPRRGLVGFANLIDLDNGNMAVVIELAPDAENVPSADGGVISSSMVFFIPEVEEISVDTVVAGSITAGNRVSYELTLADGETVNIYLNGIDGLDTVLRIYDADGALIAENDDFSGVSSGLEGFSVDGGGVVTVEVATFGDGGEGDYELVIETAAMEEEAVDDEDSEEDADEEDSEATDDEASDDEDAGDMAEEANLTIVGLALQTDGLETLSLAVVRGGFLSTLNGEGPFTVFAPTDEAFATALDTLGLTADELLADQELLSSVLTYHVVEGAVMAADLEDGMEVETLNGAILTVGVSDDGVTLTDGTGATYNVVTADVAASNGVVHVIDGVLLPPTE